VIAANDRRYPLLVAIASYERRSMDVVTGHPHPLAIDEMSDARAIVFDQPAVETVGWPSTC
jgi:hypothetical protein